MRSAAITSIAPGSRNVGRVRRTRTLVPIAVTAAALGVIGLVAPTRVAAAPRPEAANGAGSHPAASAVTGYAFPSPGTTHAATDTAVTFRGVGPAALGGLTVTGSLSGRHAGRVTALAAGRGSVFTPTEPFAAGEQVTVDAGVGLQGAPSGRYRFGVATPVAGVSVPGADLVRPPAPAASPACSPGQPVYASRPDLKPVGACVGSTAPGQAAGVILATANSGPRAGEAIYNASGSVIWTRPEPVSRASNLTAVTVDGQPMLAVFTGTTTADGGFGHGHITLFDQHYDVFGTVSASGGYELDLHEFRMTPQDTAIVGSYFPVRVPVNGRQVTVIDYVVQEIDFRHGGAVLFEWHALDHVSTSQSKFAQPSTGYWDYFHGNSIDKNSQGDYLVSGRNTWGVYSVDPESGAINWTLGKVGATGTGNSFPHLVNGGTSGWFCYQHDARWVTSTSITLYDDGGAGPAPCDGAQPTHANGHPARALSIGISTSTHTATYTRVISHDPVLYSQFTGSEERLANGNVLVDWGNAARITEYTPSGSVALDMTLGAYSYRAYKATWHGYPDVAPDAVVYRTGTPRIYVSWNGATELRSWQLMGGSTPGDLRPIGTPVARATFETQIPIPAGTRVVQVEGLDAGGNVLPHGTTRLMSGTTYSHELSGWLWRLPDYQPIVGDFGGTRAADVVFYTPGTDPDYLDLSQPGGGLAPSTRLPAINRTYTPLVGDFNGDGRDEILWWQPGQPVAYIAVAPFTQAWISITVPVVHHALVLDNLPSASGPIADGVMWWDPGSPNDEVETFTSVARGAVTASYLHDELRYDYRPVSGDFDGNGYADIFWYGPGNLPDWIHYLSGPQLGVPTSLDSVRVIADKPNYEPVVGHFGPRTDAADEDDILLFDSGPGADYLWRGQVAHQMVSSDVTTTEYGFPIVLPHGDNDAVAMMRPGYPTRLLNISAGASPDQQGVVSTVEGSGDPARPRADRVFGGDFGGTSGGGLFWFGPGDLPDSVEVPWTVVLS